MEADITKGKYGDYDTFLRAEAAEYLKLYMEQRSHGSPDGRNPPEPLTEESPLIRDATSHTPRPVEPKQIGKLVHGLYVKAGLVKQPRGRMYELRVHSLRKYFRTQLLALGVQPDYADYVMGHTVDTYHDIQMKGIDFLRNIYAATGLAIKPKTRASKMKPSRRLSAPGDTIPSRSSLEKLCLNQLQYTESRPIRNIVSYRSSAKHYTTSSAKKPLKPHDLKSVQMRSVVGGPAGI